MRQKGRDVNLTSFKTKFYHQGVIVFYLLYFIGFCIKVEATIPGQISHQGRLTDNLGNPITGTANFIFNIYDHPTLSTNLLWSETQNNTNVQNGVFSVQLGSYTPIPASLFENATERWLEIKVNNDTMSPRLKLISVPYSFIAERAYGVIGATITAGNLATNIDASGIGFNADKVDGKDANVFVSSSNPNMTGAVSITMASPLIYLNDTTSGGKNIAMKNDNVNWWHLYNVTNSNLMLSVNASTGSIVFSNPAATVDGIKLSTHNHTGGQAGVPIPTEGLSANAVTQSDWAFGGTNPTTDSITWADTDLSKTITTKAGSNVLVMFSVVCSINTANQKVQYQLLYDNAVQGCDIDYQPSTAGNYTTISFNWLVTNVTAGSHTFKIQWKVESGIANMWQRSLIVLELRR